MTGERIYIAGPMTGIPYHNRDAFNQVAQNLTALGASPVNPIDLDKMIGVEPHPEGDSSGYDLKKIARTDLGALLECDAIWMMDGWEQSKGACAEHATAEWVGLKIYYSEDQNLSLPPEEEASPKRKSKYAYWKESFATHGLSLGTFKPKAKSPPKPESSDCWGLHGDFLWKEYKTKDSNPKDSLGCQKVPYWHIPPGVKALLGLSMLEGALKYGSYNFSVEGARASVYYDAMNRHVDAWASGEDIDLESGLPHLAKAMACCAIILDTQQRGVLVDDRPPKMPEKWMDGMNKLAKELVGRHQSPPKPYTNNNL